MSNNKLADDINLGPVHLSVADLERSISFYERSIGLEQLEANGRDIVLGVGRRALVQLYEVRGARSYTNRSGLYHFALLLPTRQALGSALQRLVNTQTRITGGADHLVSEAVYLDDPDGNGIELYRDRPRAEWRYENGRVQMATLPLDFQGILEEVGGAAAGGIAPDTRMGHMHLHVARISESIDFYEGLVGLDLMLTYGPSAAFLSAAGYHHHLGINTWAGVDAAPAPENSAGLRYFTVELPRQPDLARLRQRLARAGWPFEDVQNSLFVRDPSQNSVLFTIADPAAAT